MFWWFILVCDLLMPAIMIFFGRMMWKHPPKEINYMIGYRTARSTKNIDTWKFAHDYCGRLWWKLGWIMLPLSAAVHIPFYHSSKDELSALCFLLIFSQFMILLMTVVPTERALKRTFDDEGKRK